MIQANRVGFIKPSRSWERLMLSWWAHWRATDTNTRASLASRTPTHTQHKEVSPFSATQSLRPRSSLQWSSGVVEKKASSIALSVWFSIPRFIKHIRPSFTTLMQSEDKTAACKQRNSSSGFYRGKHSPAIVAINIPRATLIPLHTIFTAITEGKYIDQKMEIEPILNLCVREARHS